MNRPTAQVMIENLPDKIEQEKLDRLLRSMKEGHEHPALDAFFRRHGPREALQLMLGALTNQEWPSLIILYYGLNGQDPLSDEQLSDYFDRMPRQYVALARERTQRKMLKYVEQTS